MQAPPCLLREERSAPGHLQTQALREGQGPNPTQGVYRGQRRATSPTEPAGHHPRLGQRAAHSKGVTLPPRVTCPILVAHQQSWVPPVHVWGVQWLQPPKATTEDVTPATLTVTRTKP